MPALPHKTARALAIAKMAAVPPARMKATGIQQPKALPTFRSRPDFVSGIPILREILFFTPEMPIARFQEKDTPGIPLLRPILPPLRLNLAAPERVRGNEFEVELWSYFTSGLPQSAVYMPNTGAPGA